MQTKTTTKYHLLPVTVAIINKWTKNKCWWRCGEKGRKHHALLVGMQIGAATIEKSMELPQKITKETALWPSNSTSENVSLEAWNTNLKDWMHPHVRGSVIYNHQDLEAAHMPISRWVNKTTLGHLHNGILLSHKKEETLQIYLDIHKYK